MLYAMTPFCTVYWIRNMARSQWLTGQLARSLALALVLVLALALVLWRASIRSMRANL